MNAPLPPPEVGPQSIIKTTHRLIMSIAFKMRRVRIRYRASMWGALTIANNNDSSVCYQNKPVKN
jgi:hypothetical protein